MRKQTILILGLLFLIGCSENTERQPKYADFENDLERENLFGKVKTIEQYKANVTDFESEETEKPIIEFKKQYTEFGKITYQEYFDNFGKSQQYIKNEYNDKEQRVKSVSENYLTSSKSTETAEFNEKGEKILANVIFNDTLNFKAIFEYNDHRNLITQVNIQNGDTTSDSFEYKYNDNGKILWKKQIENSEYGTNEYYNKFKYDQTGNLIELINKSEHFGEMKSTYEYDRKNRIEKITQYKLDKIEKETSFDKFYNQILVKFFVNETLNKEIKYEYNFDNIGNWTERKVFLKEYSGKNKKYILIFVETRKIEYYE